MEIPLNEVSVMADWHTGAAGSDCRVPYACYAVGLPAQTADVRTVALAGLNRQVAAASDCLRSGHATRSGRTHGRPPLCDQHPAHPEILTSQGPIAKRPLRLPNGVRLSEAPA